MKIKEYIEKGRKKFENFVENRSDRNKKSIIVLCVIVLVVMIVMNLCTAVKSISKSRKTEQPTQIIIPEK